jgi:hypothetical protein
LNSSIHSSKTKKIYRNPLHFRTLKDGRFLIKLSFREEKIIPKNENFEVVYTSKK